MNAFAGNYSNNRRYAKSNWLCLYQNLREEESHLMPGECAVYGDLASKYSDLTCDENLAGGSGQEGTTDQTSKQP